MEILFDCWAALLFRIGALELGNTVIYDRLIRIFIDE